MKLMLRYMAPYRFFVYITVGLKFIAVIMELFIPYILEYLIDVVAPVGRVRDIVLYGCLMIILAVFVVLFNIIANRIATASSRDAVKEMRKELFHKTIHLSGACYDEVSLPSLISRMTSDVYNVQSFLGMIQRMVVRAPIMLIGAIVVAGLMDSVLMFVLVCMLPILGLLIFYISKTGIPMFALVGESVDHIVRLMRENITGVRVIRALSQIGRAHV